ncbi:hypothetical protein EO238_28980, partial [Citrobacter sp. AAK_AS5]
QRQFDFKNLVGKSDSQAIAARENFFTKAPEPSQAFASPKIQYLQIHDSYIVVQDEEGFMIVDQHALHERIMYEELCRRLASDQSS